MKTKSILLTTAMLTLLLGGCIVKSLHPFYKDKDIEFRPELLGTWIDQDSTVWEFSERTYTESIMGKEKKDNSYKVILKDPDEEKKSWFIVTLFRLKNSICLDFEPYIEDNIGDNMAALHFVPTHSVARVDFYSDNNFAFFWYDEDWLNDLFEQNRVKISHEVITQEKNSSVESYVLTASTDELQKFLVKYGQEINIFNKINREKVMNGKDGLEKFNILESELDRVRDQNDFADIYANLRKIDGESSQ